LQAEPFQTLKYGEKKLITKEKVMKMGIGFYFIPCIWRPEILITSLFIAEFLKLLNVKVLAFMFQT